MRAQIATIITLIMVIIFLFMVLTINIGNVSQEKTMLSNASDGAALLLASMLGSLANALRIKLELYHGSDKNCEVDWSMIVSIIALIASIAFAIVTFGAGTPVATVTAAMVLGTVAISEISFGIGMYNALVAEPGVFKQVELKFQNMTMEQRMKESAMQYALFATVTDPNKVCASGKLGGGDPKDASCGGCSDPTDLDMNGDTTNCIHWFSKWYNDRLDALPRLGKVVQEFYDKTFSHSVEGQKAPRIYVWQNPQNWKPYPDEYGFWIDTNANNLPDPQEGSLKLDNAAIASDDRHNLEGVVYAHDIYFSKKSSGSGWLEKRFLPLVKQLQQYGYGNLDQGGLFATIQNINWLGDSIRDFEKDLSDLSGAAYEDRVASFDEWVKLFYQPGSQTWYDHMQEWITLAQSWIAILNTRVDQINQCVNSCSALGPYACGSALGAQVCGQTFIPKTCTRTVHKTCYDASGNPYDCSYEEDYDCSYCQDGSWCNCGPETVYTGRLCTSTHCKPTAPCSTPQGISKPCCEIANNGLYYQPCDSAPASSGGTSSGQCPTSGCDDTYYYKNCPLDANNNPITSDVRNNVITREHAVEYLTQFVNDVETLRALFKKTYEDGQVKEGDPRFYEALYEWNDKVAKGQVGQQDVHHIVYVKLSDNLKPANGFNVPYINAFREWLPPSKCYNVGSPNGSFTVTVARYDSDVGTTSQSPLRKLWIFKTRANPAGADPGSSGYTDPAAYPSTYANKAAFVLSNGIVSATEGHYGPGWTYTKAELKAGATQAAQRNRDIYIKRLK